MAIKLINLVFPVCLFAVLASAQEPSHWTLSTDKVSGQLKAGGSINAQLKADLDEGWHLYALDQPLGGPIPTTIKISDGSPFVLDGEITSPKPTIRPDQNFVVDGKPIDTKFFERSVTFGISAKANADTSVDAFGVSVRFQLCNDKFCLPPKTLKITTAGVEAVKKSTQAASADQKVKSEILTTQRADDSIWGFI